MWNPFVTEKIRLERYNVCKACKDLTLLPVELCGVCGCFIKLKITVKASECPINKWAKIIDVS